MKTAKIIVILVLVFLLFSAVFLFFNSDVILPRENISEEVRLKGCKKISVESPEDFVYVQGVNAVIVSSMNRRAIGENTGFLYFIDLLKATSNKKANKAAVKYPPNFRPHGLTFHYHKQGALIYVISHPLRGKKRHTIEVFSLKRLKGELVFNYIKTLWSPLLKNPNNLVASPDGTLYISHDNFIDSGETGGTIETKLDYLFKRRRCPVTVYYKDTFFNTEYKVTSGNGIAYLKNNTKEYIFHADAFNNRINIIEITKKEKTSFSVKKVSEISFQGMPDNLIVDEKGFCYTSVHPSLGLVMDHEKNPEVLSPTVVYRISPDFEQGKHTVRNIYSNKGSEISCGSVALEAEGRLYIGQIFNNFILTCPLLKLIFTAGTGCRKKYT